MKTDIRRNRVRPDISRPGSYRPWRDISGEARKFHREDVSPVGILPSLLLSPSLFPPPHRVSPFRRSKMCMPPRIARRVGHPFPFFSVLPPSRPLCAPLQLVVKRVRSAGLSLGVADAILSMCAAQPSDRPTPAQLLRRFCTVCRGLLLEVRTLSYTVPRGPHRNLIVPCRRPSPPSLSRPWSALRPQTRRQ